MQLPQKRLIPDERGRITLGDVAKGVSSYVAVYNDDGSIMLKPMVEIPASEQWLWKNKEALARVQRGLLQSAAGETVQFDMSLLAPDDDEL